MKSSTYVLYSAASFGDPAIEYSDPSEVLEVKESLSSSFFFVKSPAWEEELNSCYVKVTSQDYDRWTDYLSGVLFVENCQITSVDDFIGTIPEDLIPPSRSKLLDKIKSYLYEYISDIESDRESTQKFPSAKSFMEFARYVPSLPNDCDIYVDSDSGCFGVSMKNSKSKSIINILIKENHEVVYSFMKKGRGKQVPKISGRGFFENPYDASEIERIIRIFEDL